MKLIKRLTKKMEETLMECHEREIFRQEPCDTYNSRSTRGLYERGLLSTKIHVTKDGKTKTVFYVTNAGKLYLNSLAEQTHKKHPINSN
ncbi:MAG: hypothetical protein ABIO81_02240 [Ginsengibacter sp.]